MKNKSSVILTYFALFLGIIIPYPTEAVEASGILAEYVGRPDSNFKYSVKKVRNGDTKHSYAEIILTSQTWQNIPWKHQLYIIKPKELSNSNHALLLIDGGRWKGAFEDPAENRESAKFERNLKLFSFIADYSRTLIVVLRQVPHQPIWNKREDKLIAHTFDRYFKTGESDWPLLLPMVKSVVKAMDAVQDFTRREWGLSIKTFTVTGSSKRGWTTWLTAVADKRVTAIAPIVFDILKIDTQLKHQEAVYGKENHSEQISEYTELKLHNQIKTELGQKLLNMVDPYRYRDNIKLPKLIILGTNDRYWTLDAANLYWKDLPGPKYLLYMPNQGHKLLDNQKLLSSINALHQNAAFNTPLPQLNWNAMLSEKKLAIRAAFDIAPDKVWAWVAYSPTRDFREAKWDYSRVQIKRANEVHYKLNVPNDQCVAVFLEFKYVTKMPYYFSTNVQIAGPPGCNVAPKS